MYINWLRKRKSCNKLTNTFMKKKNIIFFLPVCVNFANIIGRNEYESNLLYIYLRLRFKSHICHTKNTPEIN